MARFNKHNLAVAKVASRIKVKPELASVLFTEEFTVATDAFRLVRITTPKGESAADDALKPLKLDEGLMIAADLVKGISLPKREKKIVGLDAVVVTKRDKKSMPHGVTLGTLDISKNKREYIETNAVAGTYPKYEEILNKAADDEHVTIKVNPDYLVEIVNIVRSMQSSGVGVKQLTLKVPLVANKPIIMEAKGGEEQELTAMLMPMVS